MSVRGDVDRLKRALQTDSDGECEGVPILPFRIVNAWDNEPEPEPPLCPVCRKRHFHPRQGIHFVEITVVDSDGRPAQERPGAASG
jgi:hypothetical protein